MRSAVIKVNNDKGLNQSMVLRSFSKKVTGSGILRKARSNRYHTRNQSELSQKNSAIKRLDRKKEIELLIKLGKPLPVRGRRR